MFKNILVQIPTECPVRPVIDVSVSLATQARSHLDAIAVGYESMATIGMIAEPSTAVAAVIEVEEENAKERAQAAISVFEIEARLAQIDYSTRTFVALPGEAAETFGRLARLYDLAIVLQPDRSHSSFDDYIPQGVLFNSGGPVLMVPHIHRGPLNARHIGIAWDGSRAASRALHDALPFLKAARAVTIISVNEKTIGSHDVSCSELTKFLARHRVETKTERMTADRGSVYSTILSVVADIGADMLVMGGYGHSRLREQILGGVTKGMFNSMTVPTLMSH